MKTITKSRHGGKVTARSLRTITSQIKSLSERVDSLNEKIAITGPPGSGKSVLSLQGMKTWHEIFDQKDGIKAQIVETNTPSPLHHLATAFAIAMGANARTESQAETSERPTGYACDPDSPEFNDVLMKCFADGKRKALKEAKQHGSKSKRK